MVPINNGMNHAIILRTRRQVLGTLGALALPARAQARATLRLGVPPGPVSRWASVHHSLLERRLGASVAMVGFSGDIEALKGLDAALVAPADLGRLAPALAPVPEGLTRPNSEIAWGNLLPVWRDRLARWSGVTLGLPVHGDLRVLVCLAEMLENTGRNRLFESRHGRPARAPATWREAAEWAEFWKSETGKPGWMPTPRESSERIRLFYAVAAGHVVERLSATDRARSQPLDEQVRFGLEFDLATGRCLFGSQGFVRAGEILGRLAAPSAAKPLPEPWEALARKEAAMALAPVSAIARLQRHKATRDRFSIHPVPGGDAVLPARGGPALSFPMGNLVPHLGLGGSLACVSANATDSSRAWAAAAILASPALSQDAVLDPGLGGPVREQQLETGPWDGLELDRERLDQFRAALRRTLLPLDCINPALALRMPDARDLSGALDAGISAILGGQQARATLGAVAARWDNLRAKRPEALKEARANVGLD